MKFYTLILLFLSGAMTVAAQTYAPPYGSQKSISDVQVMRTDSGPMTHLKVTFTVPAASKDVPFYNQAFFYGWIGANNQRLMVSQSKAADAPYGFTAIRQTFVPGSQVMLETDLPKSFVDAEGAHLHAGIGAVNGSFWPTQNLLVQK